MKKILSKLDTGLDIIKMDNWEKLIQNSPIEIKEIKKHRNNFLRCCSIKNKRDLNLIKESLLEARGELEKMITLILSYMKREEVQLNEKVTDIVYEEFSINFSGFMKQLDEQQDIQFVKVDEKDISLARLVAFKIFLEIAFFDIIFLPLKLAIESYQKNKNEVEFYYNWFIKVASTLKVKAGIRREGVKSSIFKGKGQYVPYSVILQNLEKREEGEKSLVEKEYEDLFESEEPKWVDEEGEIE